MDLQQVAQMADLHLVGHLLRNLLHLGQFIDPGLFLPFFQGFLCLGFVEIGSFTLIIIFIDLQNIQDRN